MIIKIDHSIYERLTSTEKQVVNYINANTDKISNMSIVEVAEKTFSSPATVSRTIKKCGVGGFSELRYMLSKKNNEDSDLGQINEILEKSLREVTNTVEQLAINNILNAIELIKKVDRIYVFARGLTELVAQEFSFKLQLLGFNSFQISDPNVMRKITAEMKNKELLVIFSLYGKTEELITSAENAVSIGARVISCCCSEDTPLKKLSTVYLKGYKYNHVSIKKFEVTSRMPLYVISRILIDYLAL
ncbi:sugar isomerase (sis) [Lucifera butyrica]|uniref:Sugar isomerase (Sis) n=1 Tax=Lucifera butyrica TaxID=1351585 RepID=A0A498RAA6_9FIRM|nr:MurR/RpiR family transcriptional regulator [Lucifera butyrica]VBB07222.1 sugar isomerase (sis) [Lucifera butyrica]